jgi:outer membrane protein assembly factor BamB
MNAIHRWARALGLGLLLASGLAGPALASDLPSPAEAGYAKAGWPQYKHDAARTADAADEAVAPPLQRVLAVKFPAPIFASAAVAGGKVYAVDARGLLACIEAAGPKVLWTAEIGGFANRSSPAVAGGKVFVGSTAGYLMVLDAATGKEVAKVPAEGGVIAAPAAAGDAVYCLTFNGKMLKVDLSGKLVWTFDGGKAANGEFMVQGKFVVVQAGPVDEKGPAEPYAWHVLEDLGDRAERRQFLRRAELEGGKVKFGNTPAGSETGIFQRDGWGPIYGVTRRGPTYLFRDAGILPGTLYWGGPTAHRAYLTGYLSQPALGKDHVVLGDADGRVCFFNFVPEKNFAGKPVWSYETSRLGKPSGGVSATAAISGGAVYIGSEDGILYGLGRGAEAQVVAVRPDAKADPGEPRPGEKPFDKLRALSTAEGLKGPEWPTVGGDMSYAGLSPDKELKPPFKIKWKTRMAGSGGQNGVIVAAGKVFAASYNGFIEALDAETGEILWRTFQPGIGRNGEYPNDGPATYADGKLLVVRRNGLWCHDATTGDLLWKNPQPVLPVPGGAPQGDGQVVFDGKVLVAWQEKGAGIETAALDLATGKEAWHTSHEWAVPPAPAGAKNVSVRVCQGALGEKTWFVSAGASRDGGEGGAIGGITMAIDPANGKQLWKSAEGGISGWGGVNCRNGVVVAYHTFGRGLVAFDAKTGKVLWDRRHGVNQPGPGCWHTMPLTDEFLASQCQRGSQGGYCSDTVWANGFFYGPPGSSSHVLSAKKPDGGEVWRYVVISRGCPAPAPAYGRLYYAGFSEGVVYCFVNKE